MTQEEFEQKQDEVSDKELTETVIKAVLEMCESGDRSFTMSVPPRVDDFDMAVFELIRRFEELKEKTSELDYPTYILYRWIPVGPHFYYRTFLSTERAPDFEEAVKQYCERTGTGRTEQVDGKGESTWYIDGREISYEVEDKKN